MKGRQIPYANAELAWLQARADWPRRKLHAEFTVRFQRADVSLNNLKGLCKRKGWMTGRTGCFEKGQTPLNKGQKMAFNANSAKTQFKAGSIPANRKPMFSERAGKDGYIEMKVPLPNPYTTSKTRYMHKHRYLWELANGPLPKGMCLKSLDGDCTNTDPANWKAVPRALLPRLVGGRWNKPMDAYEPELRPLVLTIAETEYEAKQARIAKDKP
ncbi:HNH endonuclease [Roseovarius aestuarii]|nr:HNH endonuclease [Roseovarius aestuarii]